MNIRNSTRIIAATSVVGLALFGAPAVAMAAASVTAAGPLTSVTPHTTAPAGIGWDAPAGIGWDTSTGPATM